MITLLIQKVLSMFLLSAVGYICFRTKKVTMEGCRTISNILIFLSLPCVILNGFLVEFSKEKLLGLIFSTVAALIVILVSVIISRLFFSKDAVLNFAAAFSNPGFFGVPLIVASLSDGTVFYVATFIAFTNLFQWTYGVALLTKENKKTVPGNIVKRFLTAPFMIATLVGMFFFLTRIPMPKLILQTIHSISGLNTPLAMFTIGIYFAQTNPAQMFKKVKLYKMSLVSLIVIPLVSMFVLCIFPDQFVEMKTALLLVAACPAGTNVAIYAQLYDSDYTYAVESIIISTLFSIITIPLVVKLAEMIHVI